MSRVAFWLLVAFAASIPSENGISIPGLGSLTRLLGMLAFGVGVMSLVGGGRVRLRAPSAFVVLAALFSFWSLLSYFWSLQPGATVGKSATLAQLFVMSWMIWQFCRTRRDTAILMQAFVLGCYLILLVGITTFLASDERLFRNVGSFNPNGFAIVSALGLPMAWYLGFYWRRRALSLLNFVYPAVAVLGIVLAASRGGLLTGLVALAVIPLTLARLRWGSRLLLFALIAGTTWVAFVEAPKVYPELERNLERLSRATDELESGSLTGRTVIWQAGYDLFRGSPILGIGFGSFPAAAREALGEARTVHNAYFAVAIERGLVALLLFLGMLAAVATSVFGTPARERTFFLVLLAALLVGMIPTNSENDKFAWFILALLASQRPFVLVPAAGRASPLAGQPRSSDAFESS